MCRAMMQVLNGHLQAMRREPFWGEDGQEKKFFDALQEFAKQKLDLTVKVRMQVYPCEGLQFVSKPATKCFPIKRPCWVAWSGGSVGGYLQSTRSRHWPRATAESAFVTRASQSDALPCPPPLRAEERPPC